MFFNNTICSALIFWLCFSATYGKSTLEPCPNTDHVIPAHIISRYLEKFYINYKIFVGIYSAATSDDQHQKQQDLITALTQSSAAMEFSFKIIAKPMDEVFKFRTAFRLLLIDDLEAFK